MPESFDEFAREDSENRQNHEKMTTEAASEWVVLKGFVSQFAKDGREFREQKFEWLPYPHAESLCLNFVGAALLDRTERSAGAAQKFSVRFDRRPLGSGQVWAEDKSRLEALEWSLKPAVEGEDLVWSVPQLGQTLSSAALADRIAIELSKYHASYEEAYRTLL
jgi:hypothetical protein